MLQLGITAEPELQGLAQWAQVRSQWRLTQGAINISMPEASIKVIDHQADPQEQDIIIEVLEDSASRQMVAEMMILAGEVAGRFCQAEKIPVPFRGQPQPELPPDEELLQLPAGPVRECAVRRCMPRSEVGITPSRHASLGLDVYSQATSPIRRYTDMLTHFQIKAYLRGDRLPFTPDEMQILLQEKERQLEYLNKNQGFSKETSIMYSGIVPQYSTQINLSPDALDKIKKTNIKIELMNQAVSELAEGQQEILARLDTTRLRQLLKSELLEKGISENFELGIQMVSKKMKTWK
jgi:hypothetical protein